MKRFFLSGFALALFWLAPAAQADPYLKITISDGFIPVNGTTSVDVMIESSDGTPIDLFFYSIAFRITPNTTSHSNTGSNNLSFLDPASVDYLSDPTYVFAGFSDSGMQGIIPIVDTDITNQDSLFAGDQVEPAKNLPVGNVAKLLIRFTLTSELLPFAAGDQYFISLVTDESSFATLIDVDPFFTYLDFQANQGLITVGGCGPRAGNGHADSGRISDRRAREAVASSPVRGVRGSGLLEMGLASTILRRSSHHPASQARRPHHESHHQSP